MLMLMFFKFKASTASTQFSTQVHNKYNKYNSFEIVFEYILLYSQSPIGKTNKKNILLRIDNIING